MLRPLVNRSSNSNNSQYGQNSYERGFDYVRCPQNFTLQLKGNMKKHPKPTAKENIKAIINYESTKITNNNLVSNENCHKGNISHNQKNDAHTINPLASKILSNKKMSKENYQKSVIPSQDLRSSKQRPQSVKTYTESRSGTGINYLLSSNQKNFYKKPQKRHVEQYHIPRRQSFGRKCNLSAPRHTASSQIVQCLNQTQPIILLNRKRNDLQINSATFGVIHPSTTNKRLAQDIYSSFANKQTIYPNIPSKSKHDGQNQFKTGAELGYEFRKSKQIVSQKMNEMLGNEGFWKRPNQTESLRQKRDDWRRSAFVIE